jgi:hypothetical protein
MKVLFSIALLFIVATIAHGQLTLPRQSQRENVVVTIGDCNVTVNYGRPNVRGRKIWGGLVPFNEVWRTGADENTTFEFGCDVEIDGKGLAAGKYGFHILPTEKEATLIFSRDNDRWGSFTYDSKNDALRVTVQPQTGGFAETLSYSFNDVGVSSAKVDLSWGDVSIPFSLSTGDVHARSISRIRAAISARTEDDLRPFTQGASYVLGFQLKEHYSEAISWLDSALKARETFQLLSSKSRLLAASGRVADAISVGDRAVSVGKSATPAANTSDFERFLNNLRNQ